MRKPVELVAGEGVLRSVFPVRRVMIGGKDERLDGGQSQWPKRSVTSPARSTERLKSPP